MLISEFGKSSILYQTGKTRAFHFVILGWGGGKKVRFFSMIVTNTSIPISLQWHKYNEICCDTTMSPLYLHHICSNKRQSLQHSTQTLDYSNIWLGLSTVTGQTWTGNSSFSLEKLSLNVFLDSMLNYPFLLA